MSASPAEEPTFTEDRLLGGRIRLNQPAAGYRVAIDPVFLAAAVPAEPHQLVLDVGCGAGGAMLCLAARVPHTRLCIRPRASLREHSTTSWRTRRSIGAVTPSLPRHPENRRRR
jgi:hypothetical protein